VARAGAKTPSLLIVCLAFSLVLLGPAAVGASAGPNISSVDLGTVPRGVAVDSATGTVYVVLFLNGTTLALDSQTLATVARITTPSPYAVATNPATDTVYVSQGTGPSIAVIDGSDHVVAASVTGAGVPYALAVDDDTNVILAADTGGATLWIVNGTTDSVVGHVPIEGTSALAVDTTENEAFVGNVSSDALNGTIGVVSLSSMSVTKTVPIPIAPDHFAVDPASHLLFVACGSCGSGTNFLAIDDQTFQTVYSLHLGGSPDLVAVGSSPDIYVSDAGLNRLYEVEGSTGQVLLNSTGSSDLSFTGITGMAFDQQTQNLYITENDVTNLIVLSAATSTPAQASSAEFYLLLAAPAIASACAGLTAILYLRHRQRARYTEA
jgi:DNA-binding beta-propeller fold protein YncE